MADPIPRSSAGSSISVYSPGAGSSDDGRSTARRVHQNNAGAFFDALPCVLYECDLTFQIKRVSPKSLDLLQLDPALLIGTRAFREEKVFRGDIEYLSEKLRDLDSLDSISFIHRIINDAGLPSWVTHCLWRVHAEKDQLLRGCIIPVHDDGRIKEDVDHHAVSRFIHKLGNHLQLLTLLSNSLKNQLSGSKDFDVLQQTIEKSIDLTRALSNYSQEPGWPSEVEFEEILGGVISVKEPAFVDKGIMLLIEIGESVRGTKIRGDALLLDAAIGAILQNALEATESGGKVSLTAQAHKTGGKHSSVVQILVTDSGRGIPLEDLNKVVTPFFTTKKDHDGLGLSMATRFIEIHGGTLAVKNQPSDGVQVTVILPAGLAGW